MLMYISKDPPTSEMSIVFMEYNDPSIDKETLEELLLEYKDNKKAKQFLQDFNEIYTKHEL